MSGHVRCDVTGVAFYPDLVRKCPEPHVIKRFGVGGVANVSIYTCRKCKYAKHYAMHGGLSCGYMG